VFSVGSVPRTPGRLSVVQLSEVNIRLVCERVQLSVESQPVVLEVGVKWSSAWDPVICGSAFELSFAREAEKRWRYS
jgi:hypothetical protein